MSSMLMIVPGHVRNPEWKESFIGFSVASPMLDAVTYMKKPAMSVWLALQRPEVILSSFSRRRHKQSLWSTKKSFVKTCIIS
jgi:hypothetical protein